MHSYTFYHYVCMHGCMYTRMYSINIVSMYIYMYVRPYECTINICIYTYVAMSHVQCVHTCIDLCNSKKAYYIHHGIYYYHNDIINCIYQKY